MASQMGGGPVGGGGQVAVIAPQVDRSNAVFWLGFTLILVNFALYSTPAFQTIFVAFFPGKVRAGGTQGVDATLQKLFPRTTEESYLDVIVQLLMLGALVVAAKVSDAGGTMAVIFLSALWIVWGVTHAAPIVALLSTLDPSQRT